MLSIDVNEALAGIDMMLRRAADPLPVLSRIGASEVENVRARIRGSKTSPWGDNWAPWAPSTRAHREHKGNADQGLLWDDGDLLKSIRYDAQVGAYLGGSLGVLEVGSDMSYAGYLQDGTSKMPARPFLGWNPATFAYYEAMLAGWIEFGNEREYL